jgi:hypothetical protein
MACIKDKCTSYEVHTKQRFKNIKTGKYIPIDELALYAMMTDEERAAIIERSVTIVRECRQLGKIIEIETFTDHLVPDVS